MYIGSINQNAYKQHCQQLGHMHDKFTNYDTDSYFQNNKHRKLNNC